MLEIDLKTRDVELTDALRNHVHEKFQRIEKHIDKVISTHVTLRVERGNQIADARFHLPHAEIFAEAMDNDMYVAVELLIDKLVRQLDKYREKHSKEHRRE
jgi:putative sigma-54 modulation protein